MRLAGTYVLPFGKGRKYMNSNRVLDCIAGGWAMSHFFMWNSGPLLNFGDMTATGDPTISNPTRNRYFDTSKFSVLTPYTPRTNPWYYPGLRGFGYWCWDATAVKYFPVTERVKLELRMEFYNFTNTYMPAQPVTDINKSTFGRSIDMAPGNLGREVQYSARIHF